MIHETFDEFWQREGIRFLHEGKAPTHEQQARHAWESRQEEIEDEKTVSFSALRLVYEIRVALGDNGKMMQDELIEHCKNLVKYNALLKAVNNDVARIAGERNELQSAIDEFCFHNAWSTDQWKSHPAAKRLFELRTKR